MKEVTVSLRTNHPREAGRKAQRLAWVVKDAFQDIRRGKRGRMAELSTSQIRELVVESIRQALDDDEKQRIRNRKKGITVDDLEMEQDALSFAQTELWEQLTLNDHRRMERPARELLQEHNLDVPSDSDSFLSLCREMLKAQIQCLEVIQKRTFGDYTPVEGRALFFPEAMDSPPSGETPVIVSSQQEEVDHGPLLSEVLEAYQAEKLRHKEWEVKTGLNNVAMIRDFIELTTDKAIGLLSPKDIREAKEMSSRLPTNRTKRPQYRGKTVAQLLEMDIPEEDCLSLRTLNNRGNKVRSFLTWARRQGHPVAQGLEDIYTFKAPRKKASQERNAFSMEELKTLFTSQTFAGYVTNFPHHYWTPLIALFTGMRLEEICQLHVEDVREEDGIMCFDICEGGNKSVKNASAVRFVPIHKELIALGFLSYVETVKSMGETRVFPMLKKKGDKSRYGNLVSRWFTEYRRSLGVKGDDSQGKKTFHSFRHTFATQCKYAGVDGGMTAEVEGHDTGKDMTYGRYGKAYKPSHIMEQLMSKLDYDLDLSHLKALAGEWSKPNSRWTGK